ncbi:MAG: hypothetical protein Q8P18_04745 [Pseudomonadota bacterium]|nr:hypothetical protein [Pseudomonadota bacterium]
MSDLSSELAALVADTLAAAESWRVTGAFLASTEPLAGLPAAEPWPVGAGQRPPPPRVEAPRPVAPRPMEARPPARPPAPSPMEAARPAVPPRPAEPARVALGAARPADTGPAAGIGAPAPNLAGLFGAKWQQSIRKPDDEIAQVLAGTAQCPACGAEATTLRGAGAAESKLAVIAAGPDGQRLVGDAGVMFDKMLVHVLALERGDAWVLEANACATSGAPAGTCRGVLLKQLEIVGPRLLLAMGGAAAAIVGVPTVTRGDWARWRTSDVVATFHPVELLARPAEKGATLKHLTTLRGRL